MEADDATLMRRYSETRRPHPLGTERTVLNSILKEKEQLAAIRALADPVINTSKLNVHELRDLIASNFRGIATRRRSGSTLRASGIVTGCGGLRSGVRRALSAESEYIPQFKKLTGRHPSVARYIRSFPQTQEFIERIFGAADLFDSALYSGGEELLDYRVWVHGGAPSVGDDCGGDTEEAGAGGFRLKRRIGM